MFQFLKDIKVVKELGALGVAMALAYILFKILTNDLPHVSQSIEKFSDVVQKQSEAYLQGQIQVTNVISQNTEVLRQLDRKIK